VAFRFFANSIPVPKPLDCRVTFKSMRFRARRCIQNAVCSQTAFSLLPRYKKHWARTRPPLRSWFQSYFPATSSRPRARKNRAGEQGPKPRLKVAGCQSIQFSLPPDLLGLLRRRAGESKPRAPLTSACASFALTHDLVFSAIPTGLRFSVSIRVISNYVPSCSLCQR
jgi:hypothetical protein